MPLSISIVDGKLGKLVLTKARGFREINDREALCVSKVHGDRFNNQYSSIYELDTYGW